MHPWYCTMVFCAAAAVVHASWCNLAHCQLVQLHVPESDIKEQGVLDWLWPRGHRLWPLRWPYDFEMTLDLQMTFIWPFDLAMTLDLWRDHCNDHWPSNDLQMTFIDLKWPFDREVILDLQTLKWPWNDLHWSEVTHWPWNDPWPSNIEMTFKWPSLIWSDHLTIDLQMTFIDLNWPIDLEMTLELQTLKWPAHDLHDLKWPFDHCPSLIWSNHLTLQWPLTFDVIIAMTMTIDLQMTWSDPLTFKWPLTFKHWNDLQMTFIDLKWPFDHWPTNDLHWSEVTRWPSWSEVTIWQLTFKRPSLIWSDPLTLKWPLTFKHWNDLQMMTFIDLKWPFDPLTLIDLKLPFDFKWPLTFEVMFPDRLT